MSGAMGSKPSLWEEGAIDIAMSMYYTSVTWYCDALRRRKGGPNAGDAEGNVPERLQLLRPPQGAWEGPLDEPRT